MPSRLSIRPAPRIACGPPSAGPRRAPSRSAATVTDCATWTSSRTGAGSAPLVVSMLFLEWDTSTPTMPLHTRSGAPKPRINIAKRHTLHIPSHVHHRREVMHPVAAACVLLLGAGAARAQELTYHGWHGSVDFENGRFVGCHLDSLPAAQ